MIRWIFPLFCTLALAQDPIAPHSAFEPPAAKAAASLAASTKDSPRDLLTTGEKTDFNETAPYAEAVEISHRLDDILPRCDVVNVLRIQFERQRSGLFPSIQEYCRLYGMNSERVRRAKPDLLLLAPGPINRGVELTPEVADGPHSAILQQVTNGLAVRMAVLYLLCGQPAEEG